jgi:hypothetical protein
MGGFLDKFYEIEDNFNKGKRKAGKKADSVLSKYVGSKKSRKKMSKAFGTGFDRIGKMDVNDLF